MAKRANAESQASRLRAEEERDASYTAQQTIAIQTAERLIRDARFSDAAAHLHEVPPSRRGWEWDRLWHEVRTSPHPLRIIGSHDWGIAALIRSRDGRTVVSGGQDGRVLAWETGTLRPTEFEPGRWSEGKLGWSHFQFPYKDDDPTVLTTDCIQSLCWVRDGSLAAGSTLRGHGILWDLSGPKRTVLLSHDAPLNAVASSADGGELLFGDDRGCLLLHRRAAGETRSLSVLRGSAVLKILPLQGSRWIVGQADGTVSLVDTDGGLVLGASRVSGPAWDCDFHASSSLLAVACGRGGVATFRMNARTGGLTEVDKYRLPPSSARQAEAVHAVAISPEGDVIYGGDDTGRLIAWNRGDGTLRFARLDQQETFFKPDQLSALPLPLRRRFATIAVDDVGMTAIVAGMDSSIKRWDIVGSTGDKTFRVGRDPKARFDPGDPTLLWIGDARGSLSLWDVDEGALRGKSIAAHAGGVVSLDLAAGAGVVATGGEDRCIRLWDRRGDEIRPRGPLIVHDSALRNVAISPDGGRVVAVRCAGSRDALGGGERQPPRPIPDDEGRRENGDRRARGLQLQRAHPRRRRTGSAGPSPRRIVISTARKIAHLRGRRRDRDGVASDRSEAHHRRR